MQAVRQVLRDNLEKINPDKDWSFITSQIGMFSFTGLTPPQVISPPTLNLQVHRVTRCKMNKLFSSDVAYWPCCSCGPCDVQLLSGQILFDARMLTCS